MKTLPLLCALAAFSVVGVAQELQPPQRPQQPQRPEGQGRMMQPYDASKEETLKAKVTNVSEQTRGSMTTVTLTVNVDDKEYQLMLAPTEFLKEKNASFAKDDEITIKGVKSETPRGLMIRAREVTSGENTLVLLDKDGRSVVWPQRQREQGPGRPPRQR